MLCRKWGILSQPLPLRLRDHQGIGDIKIIQDTGFSEDQSQMESYEQDRINAFMNLQKLWLPAQVKPDTTAWRKEGLRDTTPSRGSTGR